MDSNLTAVLITAAVTIGGSWLVAWQTAARFPIDQLRLAYERIAVLEGRVDDLEGKRQADALTKRKLGDHIDLLEAHIWDDKGPPPPPRPDGI